MRIYIFNFVCSHAVNLLNNLPVSCLDVLIDLPVQGGEEKYGGKNMDVIQVLLDFMEKRIDKVKFILCCEYRERCIVYTLKMTDYLSSISVCSSYSRVVTW